MVIATLLASFLVAMEGALPAQLSDAGPLGAQSAYADGTNAPTTISLVVDNATPSAGQYANLTATTDVNVELSASTIAIVDQTTGTTLKTCTVGKTCAIATRFYSGGPHTYVATVSSLTSAPVTVTRAAWAISLTVNSSVVGAGGTRTLTATANQSLSNTAGNFQIHLFDTSTGSRLGSCSSGTVCTATTTVFYTGPSHDYVALVAAAGTPAVPADATSVQAESSSVRVSRQAWTLTLTTNRTELSAGSSAILTATANQYLQNTGGSYQIHIFDATLGTRVGNCTTGTTCSVTQTIYTGGPHDYVAVVAASGTPTSVSTSTDIQVESNPVRLSRVPWTLTLATDRTVVATDQTARITGTSNQSPSSTNGAYATYFFNVTTGAQILSTTSYTYSFNLPKVPTGGPQTYVAVVAAATNPSKLDDVVDVQAQSNTVTVARAPWTLSLAVNSPTFRTKDDGAFTATANQSVGATSGAYGTYIFDLTTGDRIQACSGYYVGIICEGGDSFLTGGPHSYVAVVAAATGPPTFADAVDVQAVSNEVTLARAPWSAQLNVTLLPPSSGFPDGLYRISASANQTPAYSLPDGYNIYIFNYTTNAVEYTCQAYGISCQIVVGVNSGSYYAAVVARVGAPPLFDIQATSAGFLARPPTATASETIGGTNAAEKSCQCSHADPVNTATGEFYLPETDIGILGVGPALSVARTYSSKQAAVDGPFGYGWSANFSSRLGVVAPGTVADPQPRQVQIIQENGATVLFSEGPDQKYFAASRVMATLAFDSGTQRWTFTRNSDDVTVFDAAGALIEVKDSHGNTITVAHDSANRVTSLTSSGGRSLTLSWSGSHVVQIADSAGRTASYGYDSSGNLTSATGADGAVTAYGYNASRYMTSITRPGGGVTTNTYAGSSIVTQLDPLGRATTFVYSGSVTTMTAPGGSKTVETYSNGRLVSQTRAATTGQAATTTYVYDSASNLVAVTDPLGKTTSFTYDALGNMLSKVDALSRTTTWTYDSNRNPTSTTDPLGRQTTFSYNAVGDLVGTVSPSGRQMNWIFNGDGTVATFVNASGKTTQYLYDAAGRLSSATDPDGRTTSIGYNAAGIVTQQTAPDGQSTTITSDAAGRTLAVTDPNGHSVQYAHDPAGNLTSVTDPNGNSTSSTFDAAGQVASTTDAEGNATQYTYTPAGQLATVTDANGHTSTSSYNALGQVTSVTDANSRTTSYLYDGAGRLLSTTLPSGGVSSVVYDAAGQATESTNANGETTHFAYNLVGQLVSSTDPLGRVTTSAYNDDGLVSAITLADASTQSYSYNADGQPTSFTNADGKATAYVYSEGGQLLGKTEPGGLVSSYSYDSDGRVQVATQPDGSTASYSYDAAGQVLGVHYYSASGSTDTTFAYDPAGRPLSMTDATGTSTFVYDDVGRLITESNGAGASIGYDYDDIGQLTSLTYPGNDTVEYSYDAAGQMVSLTDWSNRTTTFDWTADGRLASQVDPNGVTETHGYDAVGQLTSIGTSSAAGVLASFDYGYDIAGQLVGNTTVLVGDTITHDYGYDPVNQLTSVATTPAGDSPATAVLSATSGGLLTTTVGGGMLAYNPAQQVTSLTPSTGPVLSFAFDARGSRTSSTVAATETTAAATTAYGYSPSGALATVTTPSASVVYTSDGRGLRQSRTAGGDAQSFTWSTAGGLPLLLDDGTHRYLYGPSSSPLAQVDDTTGEPEYLHADLLGTPRLITDEAGAVVATSSFDAFGTPVAHTGSADTAFGFTGNWADPDTGLLYLRARDYDATTGQFLTVDPAVDRTRQPYAYTGNNPLLFTDPTGLDWLSDFGAEAGAFGLGALDGLTMGISSMILSAAVPGFDCFVQQHNVAFTSGSVVAQVVQFAAIAVGTLGAGTGLAIGLVAARVAIKEAMHVAVAAAKKVITTGVSAAGRTALGAAERTVVSTGERVGIKAGVAGGESAGRPFPNSIRQQVLKENPNTCVYCRMEAPKPQVDHAIPRVNGGNATLENAQTTCAWCNGSKGPRDFPVNAPPGYTGGWPPAWWEGRP
jgi:RHS repeat-associated protein